jgi:hydrogenase nickel incorporation protein HypB
MKVKVVTNILKANARIADENRRTLHERGITTVNLMSSPGAGKTTLLARTIRDLGAKVRFGVIEGDIQGTHDAEVIAALGVPVIQINTAGGCHLDANMVQSVLGELPLDAIDLLVIENVGNLVCPAEFDLGEDAKAMLLSITEGDDKPLKYPRMFRECEVLLVNKVDLAPHLDVDLGKIRSDARALNPALEVIEVSARSGAGLEGWYRWLEGKRAGSSGRG